MPQTECQSTSLKYQTLMLERLGKTMTKMRLEGISEWSTPFRILRIADVGIRATWGFKVPRGTHALLRLFGFSPGTIQLWYDTESGFFSEAREKPGAPPIYKSVNDEVAMAILKEEVTPELVKELMTPDPYIGE